MERKFAIVLLGIVSMVTLFSNLVKSHIIHIPDDFPTIQEGIEVANSGDTIQVASGVYEEYIIIDKRLTLLGDNTQSIIDGSGDSTCVVISADSVHLESFTIRNGKHGILVGSSFNLVTGNKVIDNLARWKYQELGCYGLYVSSAHDNQIIGNTISNNLGINGVSGPWVGGPGASSCGIYLRNSFYNVLRNNYISHNSGGKGGDGWRYGGLPGGGGCGGEGCGIWLMASDSNLIANNIVSGNSGGLGGWGEDGGTDCFDGLSGNGYGVKIADSHSNCVINNTITKTYGGSYTCEGKGLGAGVFVRRSFALSLCNNILFGKESPDPWELSDSTIGILLDSSTVMVSYNDLYGNLINYYGLPDSTGMNGNISLGPMFVASDTGNFQLQYGSPCIDAGDPNIFDPDSSRSDMGAFGGPWGGGYIYEDLPPDAPKGLMAEEIPDTVVLLTWFPNTESDLRYYSVYRDTYPNPLPDSSNWIANVSPPEASYMDSFVVAKKTYYYWLTATDSQGNISDYSELFWIRVTEVEEPPNQKINPREVELEQNYPNPFNSTTAISYQLSAIGGQQSVVSLRIYNLLGQEVKTLVNKWQKGGGYEVSWDGKDEGRREVGSGIYFCRLEVRGEGLKVTRTRRMVLIR